MASTIKSLLEQNNGRIRLIEAHDSHCKQAVQMSAGDDGASFQGIWVSGLTQTTHLGIPDVELVSPLRRASLIDIDEAAPLGETRPLCAAYDADSGGNADEIPALVAVLARKGVSMIIIEDKGLSEPGKKVNSLLEGSGEQAQADMHDFANTIRAFKNVSASNNMMITARIESFTVRPTFADKAEDEACLDATLRDAVIRARVYKEAGADAIMIHSKSKQAAEVLSFIKNFRAFDTETPLVLVPTTYAETHEEVLYQAGANVIIYANHLMRAKISAAGQVFDKALMKNPALFSHDPELRACLEARNFGCLLRMLKIREAAYEEAREHCLLAEQQAMENMSAVVKCLLDGKMASKADTHIISAKDLLKINAHHVSKLEGLAPLPAQQPIV